MRWRLVLDGPQDGALNMGVDEALFNSAVEGSSPPTVRLYGWSRPTLSIGFAQNLGEVCDLEACRTLGVDTVRRPSGGRAVLHQHELTYAVTAGSDGPFWGLSVRQVYGWVSGVLRSALARTGITVDPLPPPKMAAPGPSKPAALPCFAVPTGHEIASGGRKLVGSAQKWSRRGFLQHGSILLDLDAELWSKVTGLAPEALAVAVGLRELAGRPVQPRQLVKILREEFEAAMGEPASETLLSPGERRSAELLAQSKYSSPEWNLCRTRGSFRPPAHMLF